MVPAIGLLFNSSPITAGGLALNVESGKGADVNSYGVGKLSVVVAHEMGHVMGLGHSGDSAALMYFNAGYKLNLSLADDDADGLMYLYGRDEFLRGDPLFGSCGRVSGPGGAGGGWLAFGVLLPLVAWSFLRLRRRAEAP